MNKITANWNYYIYLCKYIQLSSVSQIEELLWNLWMTPE